jgi:hypothetical protein
MTWKTWKKFISCSMATVFWRVWVGILWRLMVYYRWHTRRRVSGRYRSFCFFLFISLPLTSVHIWLFSIVLASSTRFRFALYISIEYYIPLSCLLGCSYYGSCLAAFIICICICDVRSLYGSDMLSACILSLQLTCK